jgi:hypothetical protein
VIPPAPALPPLPCRISLRHRGAIGLGSIARKPVVAPFPAAFAGFDAENDPEPEDKDHARDNGQQEQDIGRHEGAGL